MAQRSVSPSKFESQATNSPSKLSVPNRKQRNQPSARVHDIEFATEISTSLLSQVRHLHALLAEKEESLRVITLEKSNLEIEAEGFHQRLRSLDESENRYKDENWNLETQLHEHIATAREAADREKKLTQNIIAVQAEKSAAQKELDETKLSVTKLAEEHANAIKHYDVELGGAKRSIMTVENERVALQRRIEELTSQNQELAIAITQQRARSYEENHNRGPSDEDFETATDNLTPEHSPPPSPTKGTPRHSMLESETLKSSLQHAHRMIQSLKNNIHREKTEKLELKRILQDTRDELELKRVEGAPNISSVNKRKKTESKDFKKPLRPGQLGGLRSSRSEVLIEDDNWEDANGETSPTLPTAPVAARLSAVNGRDTDTGDFFETANETSDTFETANERATETEDFQTGAEDISGSDELTEIEGGPENATIRNKSPALSRAGGNRDSFQSTASLSGEEYSYSEVKTPTKNQPQRMRLKVTRGVAQRSRANSEEPNIASSPISFANSATPQRTGQTLFAELEDLDGSDQDDFIEGTPSRKSLVSRDTTLAVLSPFLRPIMVDSGTMTEDKESSPATPKANVVHPADEVGERISEDSPLRDRDRSSAQPAMSDAASQWHEEQLRNLLLSTNRIDSRPISTSAYSDMSSQYDPDIDAKLAKFPSPPDSFQRGPMPSISVVSMAPSLTMSSIVSENVEPSTDKEELTSNSTEPFSTIVPSDPAVELAIPLAFSSIQSIGTEPIEPETSLSSLRKDGVIIPRDEGSNGIVEVNQPTQEDLETSKPGNLGTVLGWGMRKPLTPTTAESASNQPAVDSELRQVPASLVSSADQSSGLGFASEHPKEPALDEGTQTSLTAAQIDTMLEDKLKAQEASKADSPAPAPASPRRAVAVTPPLRVRKSQESIGSVGRARSKFGESDLIHDSAPLKRPGSAGSNRGSLSSSHPPLPPDHKQVIAAAATRVGSSSGGQGSMGPPLFPASAYRANPTFRPRTPQSALGPGAARGGSTTPRATHTSSSSVHSPGGISRHSSVSSFASEIDTRFNMGRSGSLVPQGAEPGTDPRMIQAITQTMIGEYLWKYTRKAGREEISGNRHRRYFWVHPYTRTLYWSDGDPAQGGRAELKAKSVAIDAVRVVTDDNPMPPGLHRKSLVILTPGRTIKFTARTGQTHETWFNALSYLLLRTEDGIATGDTENVVNTALNRDDVTDFNPSYGGSRFGRRGPASLSSYNSRTTRNASPTGASLRASLHPPTLNPSSTGVIRTSPGKFSRISSYWKPGKEGVMGSFSSRRSRHSIGGQSGSIYEASEVHDSAEDLREILEKQDRESDRLENVRACCDGKCMHGVDLT